MASKIQADLKNRFPQIEMREAVDLVAYSKNPRTHTDAQLDLIERSIEEFGFTNPILIADDNTVIAGHARLQVSKRLGLKLVPTIKLSHLTKRQWQAYVIADNQIPIAGSGWDLPSLRSELLELKDAGFDLPLLGFDELQLKQFFAKSDGADPEATPEPPAEPIVRTGDLWLLGKHRLLCGDATSKSDVDRLLGGAKPHLMVTDPPYGVSYDPDWRNRADRQNGKPCGGRAIGLVSNDDRADWRAAWALFPGDVVYCWHAGQYASTVQASLGFAEFKIVSQIVWAKPRFVISRGDYHWQHEPCWYAVRKGKKHHWNGDRLQTTLWEITHQQSETGHSTQKPVDCMLRPIENNSKPGDMIYDPFIGSGTSIIAAEMTARGCLALDIDPVYCEVAIERWQNFTDECAMLEGDGRDFDAIAAERRARNSCI